MMGSIIVHVPTDWAVHSEITPMLGGLEDRSGPIVAEPAGTLVLRGAVVMGGIEVDREPMGEHGVVIGASRRRRGNRVVQVRAGRRGVIVVTKQDEDEEPSDPQASP